MKKPKSRPLAIFDLDNTIIDGDCEVIWCQFLERQGLLSEEYYAKIVQFFLQYDKGTINYPIYEEFLLQSMTALSASQLQELIEGFLSVVRSSLRSELLEIIDNHRRNDHIILLATATNSVLASPIAQHLHIQNLICTEVEIQNGQITGKLNGKPSFQEEKVHKALTWLLENEITLEDSWGYSDSINDIPLLKLVTNPVAVFPDHRLKKFALQSGWKIIERKI